jgi:hypothetical protein
MYKDMNLLLRKISIGALLLLVAGAVLFCAFSAMPQSSSAMANMPSDHTSTNHFAYIQELTAATTTANLLTIIALLAVVIAIAVGVSASTDSLVDDTSLNYFRKKQHDIFGLVKRTAHRWLSRLENSPSFVLAA